jgi:hypothetical protein
MSNVRDFGAIGDGRHDDTEAIAHALAEGDGFIEFPRGDYLITQTLTVELDKRGRLGLSGAAGTAKIIMAGSGPALHLIGTHEGSAGPETFQPNVWSRQRMPSLLNLEIEGAHPEADGVLLEGTMQATLEGLLLRHLRDGVRVTRRARNVLISHCHIYDNRRCGIWLDNANLHQVIITGSHISYNLVAGIKISGGQIRNVQITGNDIEYNYDRVEKKLTDSADILIDCRPEGATIDEMTIASNTIQAVPSPGGANIRLLGNEVNASNSTGQLAISGNLIGSQETNVHLVRSCSTVLTGNAIYAAHHKNLLIEDCRNIVVGANSIDHNTDLGTERQLATGVRIFRSRDISLTGVQIKDAIAGRHTHPEAPPLEREALIEIANCERITASGLHVIDGVPYGISVADSSDVSIVASTILEAREEKLSIAAVRWTGSGRGNMLAQCRIGGGREGGTQIDPAAGVTVSGLVE